MFWPILMIVTANTVYNICTKSAPAEVNAFASLAVTYGVAMVASIALFFLTAEQKNLPAAIGGANWTSWALGVAIVGLEFGYIMAYRAGWKISIASLVANIALALVLLAVGILLYRESVTPRQLAGAAVCAAGLILMNL